MDTNNTAVSLLRVSRGLAARITGITIVGFLAVGGIAAGVTGAGAGFSARTDVVLLDRTHKGDRLTLAPKQTSTFSSPIVTTMPRPPIGCEPAFSRAADPKRSHIFGRCIS
jgi:hypothetical protein